LVSLVFLSIPSFDLTDQFFLGNQVQVPSPRNDQPIHRLTSLLRLLPKLVADGVPFHSEDSGGYVKSLKVGQDL
jgi:hypothetical protein